MTRPQVTRLIRHPFVETVERSLRGACGVESGERIVIAISGGADSVALLRALAALAGRDQWRLDLHVAHVNHHLRAEAADDAAFVADLASGLELPLHHCDIAPAEQPGNVEANARRLRYEALASIAEQVDADHIATAHHADDQLETVLMRLIRGASIEGLRGMEARRRWRGSKWTLIRPMLGTDHEAAREFLRHIDQPWREDATNADVSRWRAAIRRRVLPVLKELRPDAATKAAQTMQRLDEAARLARRAVRTAERKYVTQAESGETCIDRESARRMDRLVLGGVMRRCCVRAGAGADGLGRRTIDPIIAAVRDGRGETRVFDVGCGVRVHVEAEAVRIVRTR